ncbi:hypothetical protein ABB37_02871 [Leptomonas pyrrhocoris]|uniref:Uncharacterized protein n=1 Tax=Leptomonas pyrrhocoris TaxID=157538 RepID=A0A0M9G5Z2_LEPPY|nr:hypothetical protein ABB37_02871 [Leptomonas pyrrhocoris]KPA83180.1 hypothetical protein ABB37_02871 [Leptomonas pyrrhocoris]|eukprot:XP_015661619.1 hypothetical protein ABB37_02871 [Leptomonas pyrrhocoris]
MRDSRELASDVSFVFCSFACLVLQTQYSRFPSHVRWKKATTAWHIAVSVAPCITFCTVRRPSSFIQSKMHRFKVCARLHISAPLNCSSLC